MIKKPLEEIQQERVLFLGLILIAIIEALAYQSIINNEFVWDDEMYIYYYPYIKNSSWINIFFEHFLYHNYYRPLPLLMFKLDYLLGDGQAWLFHLTNLSIHIINTILVALLAWRFINNDKIKNPLNIIPALLASFFYGLHPALIEPIAWISGRFDLMVTLFMLLALLIDSVKNNWLRLLGVGFCFLLAALCKEMAIVFPFILVFWHLGLAKRKIKSLSDYWRFIKENDHVWIYLAVLIAGLIYLGFRYTSLGYIMSPSTTSSITTSGSTLQHLLLIAKSLGLYFSLILWPFSQLSPLHEHVFPVPLTDIGAWSSLLIVTLLLVIWLLRVYSYPRLFWMGLAFLISFAPVIHLLPLPVGFNIVNERFLTFPLALFALLLSGILDQFKIHIIQYLKPYQNPKFISMIVFATLWFGLAILNIQVTVPLWATSYSLWSWAYQREPGSDVAKKYLMHQYVFRDPQKAKELFYQLQKIDVYAWKAYGTILSQEEKYQDALDVYQDLIPFLSENDLLSKMLAAEIYNNIGACQSNLNNDYEAEKSFLKALSVYPYTADSYINLSAIYLKNNRFLEAARSLEIAEKYSYKEAIEKIKNLKQNLEKSQNNSE